MICFILSYCYIILLHDALECSLWKWKSAALRVCWWPCLYLWKICIVTWSHTNLRKVHQSEKRTHNTNPCSCTTAGRSGILFTLSRMTDPRTWTHLFSHSELKPTDTLGQPFPPNPHGCGQSFRLLDTISEWIGSVCKHRGSIWTPDLSNSDNNLWLPPISWAMPWRTVEQLRTLTDRPELLRAALTNRLVNKTSQYQLHFLSQSIKSSMLQINTFEETVSSQTIHLSYNLNQINN